MEGDGRSFNCFQHHGSLSAGTLQILRMSWGSSFTLSILSAGHLGFVCGQERNDGQNRIGDYWLILIMGGGQLIFADHIIVNIGSVRSKGNDWMG
jgi:hypothetical protein